MYQITSATLAVAVAFTACAQLAVAQQPGSTPTNAPGFGQPVDPPRSTLRRIVTFRNDSDLPIIGKPDLTNDGWNDDVELRQFPVEPGHAFQLSLPVSEYRNLDFCYGAPRVNGRMQPYKSIAYRYLDVGVGITYLQVRFDVAEYQGGGDAYSHDFGNWWADYATQDLQENGQYELCGSHSRQVHEFVSFKETGTYTVAPMHTYLITRNVYLHSTGGRTTTLSIDEATETAVLNVRRPDGTTGLLKFYEW